MSEEAVGDKRSREEDNATAPAAEPPAAAPAFAPPAEAGAVNHAELWYFIDNHGIEQGPHGVDGMRAWLEAGYFPPTHRVAASYYGEVPETFFAIQELWEDPTREAFVPAVTRAVEEPPDVRPEYIASEKFDGAKEGYCFKADLYGVGYYLDNPPEIDAKCTWQYLEKVWLCGSPASCLCAAPPHHLTTSSVPFVSPVRRIRRSERRRADDCIRQCTSQARGRAEVAAALGRAEAMHGTDASQLG